MLTSANIRSLKKLFIWMLLILIILVTFVPIYWMINTSFKEKREMLTKVPVWIPKEPTFDNYRKAISNPRSRKALFNSLTVALASTALSLLFGSLAAYGLARSNLRWSNNLSLWILSTRMLPPAATVIPIYLLMMKLNLIDTRIALIIVYTVYNLPFTVWMMEGFFAEIPESLEESAQVDGCSALGAFLRISVPLAKSGLVVTAIFSFVFAWNEFLYALVLTRINAVTLPLEISTFAGVKGVMWGKMAALSTIGVLPALILAIGAQRYLVRGLTLGAVKG